MDSISQLIGYTRGLKKLFILIGSLSVAGALINLLTPLIMKFATDWVVAVVSDEKGFEVSILVWLVVAFIISMLMATAVADIGGYFVISWRSELVSSYQRLIFSICYVCRKITTTARLLAK